MTKIRKYRTPAAHFKWLQERAVQEQREADERTVQEQREAAERAVQEQRKAAERAVQEQRKAAAKNHTAHDSVASMPRCKKVTFDFTDTVELEVVKPL